MFVGNVMFVVEPANDPLAMLACGKYASVPTCAPWANALTCEVLANTPRRHFSCFMICSEMYFCC